MGGKLEEIRRRGLGALRRELGRAGMIRFLQQFEPGAGDYAKERHAWVDRMSLKELANAAHRPASPRGRGKSKRSKRGK
jgi:hypothetical protein